MPNSTPPVQQHPLQKETLISSCFCPPNVDPFETVEWAKKHITLKNEQGEVIYENTVEYPTNWSDQSVQIVASKYFYGGVNDVIQENSVRQLIHRVARTIADWGFDDGYFKTKEETETFYKELSWLVLHQHGAFNSPVFFSCGLGHVYKLRCGGNHTFYAFDKKKKKVVRTKDILERPNCSACYILSMEDSMEAIMNFSSTEAMIYKWGCTSGDSSIYVSDMGLVTIRELFKRFASLNLGLTLMSDGKTGYYDISSANLHTIGINPKTGDFQKSLITKIWTNAVNKADKVRVRLNNGAIEDVSSWHPFFVWNGKELVEKRADKLETGDALVSPNQDVLGLLPRGPYVHKWQSSYKASQKAKEFTEQHEITIDSDVGWLLGYFIGNGSLCSYQTRTGKYTYHKPRLRFYDETSSNIERVRHILMKKFGVKSISIGKSRNTIGFSTTTRFPVSFFSSIFGVGPKRYSVRIPSFIYRCGEDVIRSFLAGLIDSDGTCDRGRAIVGTTSQELAKDLSLLASLAGVGGGYRINQPRRANERTFYTCTVVSKRRDGSKIANLMSHKKRAANVMAQINRRSRCNISVSEDMAHDVFSEQTAYPHDYKTLNGVNIVSLKYKKRRINPSKCERLFGEKSLVGKLSASFVFVEAVEPLDTDVDFYDLTVEGINNYLCGQGALSIVHNSGAGSNWSPLRSSRESLSGGGRPSGPLSFMRISDAIGATVKSGGKLRRAASMKILNVDHPDIVEFIDAKVIEERKAKALIRAGYSGGMDGDAYSTVQFQNSNFSVHVTDKFMKACVDDADWETRAVTDGRVVDTLKARSILHKMAEAAWECGDPGVQFHDTINKWNTCSKSGEIVSSNPCVTGDTLLLVFDESEDRFVLKRIDELKDRKLRIMSYDFENKQTIVTSAINLGKTRENAKVIKVKTPKGDIRLTPDHKVMTQRGWVKAGELVKGDKIYRLKGQTNETGNKQTDRTKDKL